MSESLTEALLRISTVLLTTVLTLATADVFAQNTAPGANGTGSSIGTTSPSIGSIVIGTIERRILQDYFQRQLNLYQIEINTPEPVVQQSNGKPGKNGHKKNKHKKIPPGLAKKGTLPPGIAKQLAANQQLPPGLQYRQLPGEVLNKLPQAPTGTRYLLVDDKVLLVQSATNLILDTLQVAAANILQ